MNRRDHLKSIMQIVMRRLPGKQGNTLAYIAMVLIIFGVIGVAMISLLTSSVIAENTFFMRPRSPSTIISSERNIGIPALKSVAS